MPTSKMFGIGLILHLRGCHRTDLHSINIRHQPHPRFLSPIHLLQTVRKLVFTAGLLGLPFSPGRGRLCCFPFVAYCVSRKEPYDSPVSYLLVNCTPLFFSNFALCGEMFDLRWTRSRRSNITCSLFSNWRQWTQTCSLHCCTCWSWRCSWSGCCSWEKTVGKSQVELYIDWKNRLRCNENHRTLWSVWLVVCYNAQLVHVDSSESSNTGYRILGVRHIGIQR